MRALAKLGRLAVVALAAAACGESTGPQNPEDVSFAPSLGIDLAQMTKLPSGVYIQTTTAGTGTAQVVATNQVTIDYKLWVPNGTQLDGGRLTNFPAGDFIPGFTLGVTGMKVGEVRRIVIPSELGYGETGFGQVPPNAVLVFEVTMVSFR